METLWLLSQKTPSSAGVFQWTSANVTASFLVYAMVPPDISLNPFGGSHRAVDFIFEFCQTIRDRSDATVIVENRFRPAPVGNRQNCRGPIRVNRVAVVFVAIAIVVLQLKETASFQITD